VVGNGERAIVDALNAPDIATPNVFTTGGIAPTHGDSPPTAWQRRSVCRSTPIRARSPSCTNE